MMRAVATLLAGACAAAFAVPLQAQDTGATDQSTADDSGAPVIIVTAQRRNEALQTVPIAVSAFDAQALERQQIKNTSDLQLTLPNITFTKTNFTGSSFTIRGIGDLCTGVTCDAATAITLNEAPLAATRLFEGEFYDLAEIEVLRGPQGTLFGRNATSGVVDIITAKPDLTGIHASLEGEYGNYDSKKVKGMFNFPLTETLGVRVAGFYLNRDGYTENLYNNSRIDDRDEYGVRGSLRWEPTPTTTIDIMGQYFHEDDNRLRIQKQLCQRDPTGVLGCLNGNRGYQNTNNNATFVGVLTSKEFLATQGIPAFFALGSLYGTDALAGSLNPTDPRVVNTAYTPTYYTRETIIQGSIDQKIGDSYDLKLQGNYQNVAVDSTQDYNLAVQNRAVIQPALNSLAAGAAGAFAPFGLPAAVFQPLAAALIPQGPAGPVCTSLGEDSGTGVYGGHSICSAVPLSFDRSDNFSHNYSVEGIFSSDYAGPFNFLVGGIYSHFRNVENSYYVDAFGIDYFAGLFGALPSGGAGFLGTPTYRNNTLDYTLNSYGIFGETYYNFNDRLKLTLGLRYSHDAKNVTARTTLANFLVPFGSTDAFSSPFVAGYDADPTNPGNQLVQVRSVRQGRLTGRAVLDFQFTPDNLLYASYSRGYKSGGINPPLSPGTGVPETFKPEQVDAFEVGSKNSFGRMQLNLTGFYYKYKDLQLSSIVAKTSVNNNIDANIYGAELEAIIRPVRAFTVNATFSYLHTSVSSDDAFPNPRDFGGGRSDAVIIKEITPAATGAGAGGNCAVVPNTPGNAAGANGFVNTVNGAINAGAIPGLAAGAGLQNTTPFPVGSGIASTGAFSSCAALAALAGSVGAGFDPAGISVLLSGVPVGLKGRELPGAPNIKASAGAQYEIDLGNLSLTPRADVILTGSSYGNIFNGNVNRIPSYTQANAQIQLDGPDKRWFVRGFIQNIFDDNSITGLYVTDQSSGLYTNIFTLEPRRYGIAAGFIF